MTRQTPHGIFDAMMGGVRGPQLQRRKSRAGCVATQAEAASYDSRTGRQAYASRAHAQTLRAHSGPDQHNLPSVPCTALVCVQRLFTSRAVSAKKGNAALRCLLHRCMCELGATPTSLSIVRTHPRHAPQPCHSIARLGQSRCSRVTRKKFDSVSDPPVCRHRPWRSA